MQALTALQKSLGHQFRDIAHLELALMHRSYAQQHNERLEFLGDAILDLIITEQLYRQYPKVAEGELTRLRSVLVNKEQLVVLANALHLSDFIKLNPNGYKLNIQHRPSVLADTLEAIIAAIYLDGGLAICQGCVMHWYQSHGPNWSQLIENSKDAKTLLQEWAQAEHASLPQYSITIHGKAHAQVFSASCRITEYPHEATGQGSNRRMAEQNAAQAYLALIKNL